MPTGPLYLGPLITAYAKSTNIGAAPVSNIADAQPNFQLARREDGSVAFAPATETAKSLAGSDARAAIATTLSGLLKLQQGREGAQTITQVKLAATDEGYIANRSVSTVDNHPESFEYADPAKAAEIGVKIAQQAEEELRSGVIARFAGGTLDLAPQATKLLTAVRKQGELVDASDAAALGAHVGREIERSITPLPPDATSRVQWLEDGSINLLATWKGNVEAVVAAVGMPVDAAKFAQAVTQQREQVMKDTDATAVAKLLQLAGVNPESQDDLPRARLLLQSTDHGSVPGALARSIAEARGITADRVDWLAGRIVETGGIPGNIDGLAAQLTASRPPSSG